MNQREASMAADPHGAAGEAWSLSGASYTSAEFYARERATLFSNGWVAAAVASEVPMPGDAIARTVAGWKVLFVRDRAGVIRCFHNICRHRGMAVLTQDCSGLPSLQCPWHGWSYGLNGRLRGTPEFAGPQANTVPGFERSANGLVEVRTARWFDFIFVNFGGRAAPLEHCLLPLTERLGAYGQFAAFKHAQSWRWVYESNWKIAVEGAIEDYHLPFLHPQITHGQMRAERSGVEIGGDCFVLVSSQTADLMSTRTPPGIEALPQLEGLTGAAATSTLFLNIFPTGVMGIAPDGLYIGTWLPDGPTRTELSFHFYLVGEEAAHGSRCEAARIHWIERIKHVFMQDSPIVHAVQENAGARDSLGLGTHLSPFWERGVRHFQQQVQRLVDADPAA
jgi:choline monooxygenase